MDVEATVREFLRSNLGGSAGDASLSRDESLLDSGLLDSASILEIVSFLEERFDFTIADEDLVPENFETIASIERLVEARGAESATGESGA